MNKTVSKSLSRRRFIDYLAGSPFYLPLALRAQTPAEALINSPGEAINIFDFIPVAQNNISAAHWAYLMTGTDDNRTVQANREGFQLFQIRPRRFVNIENTDTSVELFGQQYPSPVMLAPIGSQQAFHSEGELASARAAHAREAQLILSTLTSYDVREVAKEYQRPLWFQLYPTTEWDVTRQLIERADRADCPVLVLTADNPVRSNREMQKRAGDKAQP